MVSAASEDTACFAALEFCDVGGEDELLLCLGDAMVPKMIDAECDDQSIVVTDVSVAIAIEFFDAFGELAEAGGDGFGRGDRLNHIAQLQSGFTAKLGNVPSDIACFFDFFGFGSGEIFGDFSDESEGGIPEVSIAIGVDRGVTGLGLVVSEVHGGLILDITIALQDSSSGSTQALILA
jgi:hypothetical protein